jgi:hypothetical protein
VQEGTQYKPFCDTDLDIFGTHDTGHSQHVILVAKYDSKGFVVKLKLTLYEITK